MDRVYTTEFILFLENIHLKLSKIHFQMENSVTITAFFLFASLYKKEGQVTFIQFGGNIPFSIYWNRVSIYDRLFPLKPKNPI
jgi:hypothetical protein